MAGVRRGWSICFRWFSTKRPPKTPARSAVKCVNLRQVLQSAATPAQKPTGPTNGSPTMRPTRAPTDIVHRCTAAARVQGHVTIFSVLEPTQSDTELHSKSGIGSGCLGELQFGIGLATGIGKEAGRGNVAI